jgi:hypothetical protein|nr:hypothetical protein [Kofleriaceae bacterium]
MSKKLGWLGPAILITGLAVGGLGVWYWRTATPVAGDIIDTIPLDGTQSIVIRDEAGGDRSFVELHDGDELEWQALVPRYAGSPGRPGVAWGRGVVTVRVERGGEQELWVLGLKDAMKVASLRLAPEHEPIPPQTDMPLTLTDHVRSYEIIQGEHNKWNQMVGIDLATGQALWKIELGWPKVLTATITGGQIVVDQAPDSDGPIHRLVNPFNGRWYFPGKAHVDPAAKYNLPL